MGQLLGCRDLPKGKFDEVKQELMQAGELRELKTKNEKIHVLIAFIPLPFTFIYYEELETLCVTLGYPNQLFRVFLSF